MCGGLIRLQDAGHGTSSDVLPRVRERAVRLVLEQRDEYPSEYDAPRSVSAKLGVGSAETVRKWVRPAEIGAGARPGLTTAEKIKALKRENAELRRANEILKEASSYAA